MELNNYQSQATKTASYPQLGHNLIYPALGLVGEAGEVAEKIKKAWRNYGAMTDEQLKEDDYKSLVKELGDVLWYVAALCNELKIDMNYVAQVNLDKLADRSKRGVVKSSGDNR